ncbi:hypothetical protein BVRB_7g163690 [Beta vulgaris subsp. vulgaris]|nr:hypothetical protein BVRB_7g163690 [Beta vulgaris subsp. vulgaris]
MFCCVSNLVSQFIKLLPPIRGIDRKSERKGALAKRR